MQVSQSFSAPFSFEAEKEFPLSDEAACYFFSLASSSAHEERRECSGTAEAAHDEARPSKVWQTDGIYRPSIPLSQRRGEREGVVARQTYSLRTLGTRKCILCLYSISQLTPDDVFIPPRQIKKLLTDNVKRFLFYEGFRKSQHLEQAVMASLKMQVRVHREGCYGDALCRSVFVGIIGCGVVGWAPQIIRCLEGRQNFMRVKPWHSYGGFMAVCELRKDLRWLPVCVVMGPPYAGVLRPYGELYVTEVSTVSRGFRLRKEISGLHAFLLPFVQVVYDGNRKGKRHAYAFEAELEPLGSWEAMIDSKRRRR